MLIRGPAGSGKSTLALALIGPMTAGQFGFTRLVADDRSRVEPAHGRLLVRPPDALAGLIEVRGLGIRRLPYEPVAAVGWVIDLHSEDAERLPPRPSCATIASVTLPRLAIAPCADALPVLLAALRMRAVETRGD